MRPVEFSGAINRTTDYASIKQNEQTRPQVEQNNIQIQQEKTIERNSGMVVRERSSEWKNEKFDAKEKGKNKYMASGKKKKEDKEDGKVSVKKPLSFDIKI